MIGSTNNPLKKRLISGGKSIASLFENQTSLNQNLLWGGTGFLVIILFGLWQYRQILFIPNLNELYPWGNDALNHVMKMVDLRENIANGVFYPEFFPNWYLGVQLLRYYPPVSYYLLAGLYMLVGQPTLAVAWFIVLTAIIGGLSWLLFHRWIGRIPAILGGMLFMILQDNVRVALVEGNYPRSVTTAIIPLLGYFLVRLLENEQSVGLKLGLAGVFAIDVLGQPQLAAIYAVCSALIAGLAFIFKQTSWRQLLTIIGSISVGILLSAWWLLPSLVGLHGGNIAFWTTITFPITDFLNPAWRDSSSVYIGAILVISATIILFIPKKRNFIATSMILVGLGSVAANTPGFNDLFNAIPVVNQFLYPYRFLGIASFLLLFAIFLQLRSWKNYSLVAAIFIAIMIGFDSYPFTQQIEMRLPRADLREFSETLDQSQGWRVATLDRNSFGPGPAYFFTHLGHREQVYGWSFPAAQTAELISSLDEAVLFGDDAYLIDRLNLLGVDDVVVAANTPNLLDKNTALVSAGFTIQSVGKTATLYHRDGNPRAIRGQWPILGIGRGARNFSILFPQVIVGTSEYLDDYPLDLLQSFETIVISGFKWHSRSIAEALVQACAESGVRVIVDLSGVEHDPLARLPKFLDVWGETILLVPEPILVVQGETQFQLNKFGLENELWQAQIPQGLDVVTHEFDYLGETATLLGYKTNPGEKIWFIGVNLPYHAFLTHDKVAVEIISELLQLLPAQKNDYAYTYLTNYRADHMGYQFDYSLDQPETLLIPVAWHDGTRVAIDGKIVDFFSFEKLVMFAAPAGQHRVDITIEKTPIYFLGLGVSLGTALLIGAIYLFSRKQTRQDEMEQL
jgi:uncharacterized membrane protein